MDVGGAWPSARVGPCRSRPPDPATRGASTSSSATAGCSMAPAIPGTAPTSAFAATASLAVGSLGGAKGATMVDAHDRFVSPGFIDVHSHAGPGLLTAGLKHGQPVLAQGITTVLVNPDGGGPVDLAGQRATYEKQGIGPNIGLFVPHGSIRQQVMGMSDRDPDAGDLAKMVALAREGMEAGGVGLSSGLVLRAGQLLEDR